MAKQEWHNWGRFIGLVAVIIFAGGGYAIKVHDNSADIVKIDSKTHANEQDIHALQLNSKDLENMSSATLGVLKEIKDDVKGIGVEQMQMRIDMTQMKGQLNNLEGVQ